MGYVFEQNSTAFYLILVAAGCVGYGVWIHWLKTYRMPIKVILPLLAIAIPLGTIGGHLAYFVINKLPLSESSFFFFTLHGWRSGYSSLGLGVGFALAAIIIVKSRKLQFTKFLDQLAPLAFGAVAMGRVVCLVNGCCHGVAAEIPWGVCFPVEPHSAILTHPSHPVQAYEALASIAVYFLLPVIVSRFRLQTGGGVIALLCLLVYLALRFILEFYRLGASADPLFLGLSLIQLIALAIWLPILSILIAKALLKSRSSITKM